MTTTDGDRLLLGEIHAMCQEGVRQRQNLYAKVDSLERTTSELLVGGCRPARDNAKRVRRVEVALLVLLLGGGAGAGGWHLVKTLFLGG